MSYRILFNWLIPPLNSLEKELIGALAGKLSPEAKKILLKQVERIKFVQRHANNKEVNLYYIEDSEASFDERFPLNQPEIKFASISFNNLLLKKDFLVNFWLVHGRLFSLEFNQSPKKLQYKDININYVRILVNPMVPVTTEQRKRIQANVLTGWLKEWSNKWQLTELKEPLLVEQLKSLTNALNVKLPIDYLELVTQTEGMRIDGCLIYGISEVRDLIMPTQNYYILAEIAENGVFTVIQETSDSLIYFISYGDDQQINLGTSFRFAIEQQLKMISGK